MSTYLTTLSAALALTAVATTAMAGQFDWVGPNGVWSDPANWAGAPGEYPSTVNDLATVSGGPLEVLLDVNIALGELTISGGADVYNSDYSIFVQGDTTIEGFGAYLILNDSPALRDLDTDTLVIDDGGKLVVSDGLAQVDEQLIIDNASAILGTGIIEMDSTTGDLELLGGVLWAFGDAQADTLVIRRTADSTSRLDWSHMDTSLTAWTNSILDVQLPYTGFLADEIDVNTNALFRSQEGFTTAVGSLIDLWGDDVGLNRKARIEAPWMDVRGTMIVRRDAEIEAGTLWVRGLVEINVVEGHPARLIHDTDVTAYETADIVGSGDATSIGFTGGALSVIGNGNTTVTMGAESVFDLDGGNGDLEVTINGDAGLVLNVEQIDLDVNDPVFNSTMSVEGTLFVEPRGSQPYWSSAGEINIDGGEINGRSLRNQGTIIGRGSFGATVINDGLLAAENGTLFLNGGADLDGSEIGSAEDGHVHAIIGDVVVGGNVGVQYFSGTMVVGDGAGGVREIVEMNQPFRLVVDDPAVGSLTLNAGRLRADSIVQESQLMVTGVSLLRASGGEPQDIVRFGASSTSTIIGTLELDGDTIIEAGASFPGEGTLQGVNTNDTIDLADAASTGDVSIETVGSVSVNDEAEWVGQSSVAGLTLAPTSSLRIDLAGLEPGTGHDRIDVFEHAALDGTLVLMTRANFVPPSGSQYVVLAAGATSGGFDAVDVSGLGSGKGAAVEITSDSVIVTITCIADIADNDFDVNVGDLLLLLANWGTDGDGAAIAAPNDIVDISDLLTMLAAWGSCD